MHQAVRKCQVGKVGGLEHMINTGPIISQTNYQIHNKTLKVPLPCYYSIPTAWSQNSQQIFSHHVETTSTYYNFCLYPRGLCVYCVSPSPVHNVLSVLLAVQCQ